MPPFLSMLASGLTKAAPYYLGVEAVFWVVFHQYLVPRANQMVAPAPYRDYGNDRSKLMVRVMRRMEATCAMNHENITQTIYQFLSDWFQVTPRRDDNVLKKDDANYPIEKKSSSSLPSLSRTSTSSPSSSPENSDVETEETIIQNSSSQHVCPLPKEDMDDFFAWAFFGKRQASLVDWERTELDKIYQLVAQEQDIVFPPRESSAVIAKPRCMTLEPVNALHRPLLVYVVVGMVRMMGGWFLRFMGYRKITAATGLVAWYRPAAKSSSCNYLPLLFFHGIAPTGLMLYLPMVLWGMATEPERPVLLFENKSISCCMDFHPLTEEQTVQGISEIVDHCLGESSPLSVVGHSFGSCPITWLLASPHLASRVQQVVLLDPVAILLSEPDVMVNFLYAQQHDKIRMVASSELFTEYYLRRHFAWYNSEMWLEDLRKSQKLLVCLSAKDQIVPADKVRQELERHASEQPENPPTTVYWNRAKHGDCIASPRKWRQIKNAMLKQELEILQRKK